MSKKIDKQLNEKNRKKGSEDKATLEKSELKVLVLSMWEL